MCELKRRDLLLGASAMLLYGCGDAEKYNQGKDYYPVATSSGNVYHWGKNEVIKINSNADNSNYPPSTGYETAFREGLSLWDETLSSIGITVEYTTGNDADVKGIWKEGNDVGEGILGYATTFDGYYRKYIVMTNSVLYEGSLYAHPLSRVKSTAAHEFGHMLGIWTHSFDSNDIMYPLDTGQSELSHRDKATLKDFLYQMTPDIDMHQMAGPSPSMLHKINPEPISTFYTITGCVIHEI